jgi:hypothetical protein
MQPSWIVIRRQKSRQLIIFMAKPKSLMCSHCEPPVFTLQYKHTHIWGLTIKTYMKLSPIMRIQWDSLEGL